MTPEIRTVTLERDYPQPPDRLWRALTQPHLIAEWLMPNDFKPEADHPFTLKGEWGGVIECRVIEVTPMTRLSYAWNFNAEEAAYNLRSTVTFRLEPTATGTKLTMEQTGFRPEQTQAFHGARAGWAAFLDRLAAVAATA